MKYSVYCDKKHTVSIERKADSGSPFEITVDKATHNVAMRKVQEDGTMKTLMIDHRVVPVEVERRGDGMPVRVFLKGVPYDVEISKVASTRFRPPAPEREISGAVHANLPGQIVEFMVREGDSVEQGTPLAILDAMKMENEILAPRSGTVRHIAVELNAILAKGDLILEID
jgi:biotin carboxyl carrier protein